MRASLDPRRSAALILLIAFALRIWDFGNPVIHVDEQYYLLVGDRMLHGAVPYIDIWDRKPPGLFLLYAAIRLLPGDGILAYQIVATLFAAATAMLVAQGGRMLGARETGALGAAAIYLILLTLLGGRGGQSPVFYNLFVAAAAVLTLRLPDLAAGGRRGAIVTNGFTACLLAGLAVQTKYTPVFEGAFLGCVHVWYLHKAGTRLPMLAAAASLWLITGAAPTLLAIGYYAALGPQALHAFWFANATSIMLRPGYPIDQLAMRLLGIFAQLSPLILCAGMSWHWRPAAQPGRGRWLIAYGWLIAATIGFFAIGTFFDHYALPLAAPLTIAAAPMLERSRRALIATLVLGLMLAGIERIVHHNDAAGAREVANVVASNSGNACPYVFAGDTATYLLAHACLPTAYTFPNFLSYTTEQGATGIDEAAEVRRILANHPPVIVTVDRKLDIWNRASKAALDEALGHDYRLVFMAKRNTYHTLVYLRRDRPFNP